jgi:hypothetical protein
MDETYVEPGSDLVYLGAVRYDFGNGYKLGQVRVGVYNDNAEDDTVIFLDVDEALLVSKQLRKAAKLAKKGAK